MRKKSLNLLFTALLAASLLAGCGSSKGGVMMNQSAADTAAATTEAAASEYLYDAGYGSYEEYDYEYDVVEEPMAEEAPVEAGGMQEAEEVKGDPQAGRKLITTMDISTETEYFDELMGNLEKQVAELGGYIESSSQWNGSVDYYGNRMGNRNAYLRIRIPAEKLNSFLGMMEESSNITNKSQNIEDVTLAYVDLESHKKALLTEQERLLELMEMAETVEDLITIEDKLANVRYQLESMESQLRTYDNKINYSTVNLDVQEVERLTPEEEPTVWGRIRSGFSENMYRAGQDIQNFLINIIINIPYIVIWLVILAVILLIVFLLAKREKRKKAERQIKQVSMGTASVKQSGVLSGGKLPVQNSMQQTVNKPEEEDQKQQMEEMLDDTMIMPEEEQQKEKKLP